MSRMSLETPALPPCNLRTCRSVSEPYTFTRRDQVTSVCLRNTFWRASNLGVAHWSPNTEPRCRTLEPQHCWRRLPLPDALPTSSSDYNTFYYFWVESFGGEEKKGTHSSFHHGHKGSHPLNFPDQTKLQTGVPSMYFLWSLYTF